MIAETDASERARPNERRLGALDISKGDQGRLEKTQAEVAFPGTYQAADEKNRFGEGEKKQQEASRDQSPRRAYMRTNPTAPDSLGRVGLLYNPYYHVVPTHIVFFS